MLYEKYHVVLSVLFHYIAFTLNIKESSLKKCLKCWSNIAKKIVCGAVINVIIPSPYFSFSNWKNFDKLQRRIIWVVATFNTNCNMADIAVYTQKICEKLTRSHARSMISWPSFILIWLIVISDYFTKIPSYDFTWGEEYCPLR